MNILFLDTETGGLDTSRHSMLSVAIITVDSAFAEVDRFMSYVQQPEFLVTAEAMALNKIDLRDAPSWPSPDTVKRAMLQFLQLPESILKGVENDRGRWQIFGKNPGYDVSILKAFLGEQVFRSMFVHNTRDITEMYLCLAEAGVYPPLVRRKLQDIVAALGIEHDQDALHNAMYDAEMTLKCAQKMSPAYKFLKRLVLDYRSKQKAQKVR